MRKRWNLEPHVGEYFRPDLGDGKSFAIRGLAEHRTPGIDHHRMSVGDAFFRVASNLGRCEDVALVLDRTGAKQYLPMIFSGHQGECRWDRQQRGSQRRKAAIQLRKAKVVTNR